MYYICTTSARRRRRWIDVVQMLYKCFVCAGCITQPTYPDTWSFRGIVSYAYNMHTIILNRSYINTFLLSDFPDWHATDAALFAYTPGVIHIAVIRVKVRLLP